MKLDRKLELALQSVKSIATHDDAPTAEVEKVLDALVAGVKAEKANIRPRKNETLSAKVKLLAKAFTNLWH
jgi:hypothetical protein